jgi:hypothetical protein
VKIGVDLPMSGGERPNGVPTNNGVILAIEEPNNASGPYHFEEALKDDALNGIYDPAKGARNVLELIADAKVVRRIVRLAGAWVDVRTVDLLGAGSRSGE